MHFGHSLARQQSFGGGENKLLKTCFKVQVFENTALSSLCELQKCELVKTVAWHAELSVQSSVHKQKKNPQKKSFLQ